MRAPYPDMTPVQYRTARRQLGWSQARLAHAAGVSQPLVSVFERGQYVPVGDSAGRMAAAMEAAVVKLMNDEAAADQP